MSLQLWPDVDVGRRVGEAVSHCPPPRTPHPKVQHFSDRVPAHSTARRLVSLKRKYTLTDNLSFVCTASYRGSHAIPGLTVPGWAWSVASDAHVGLQGDVHLPAQGLGPGLVRVPEYHLLARARQTEAKEMCGKSVASSLATVAHLDMCELHSQVLKWKDPVLKLK